MPTYICKFQDGDNCYYLEWSTIVDAPVTSGMSLEEFQNYYKENYGTKGLEDLPFRLHRVEERGTSNPYESLDSLISFNRAGENESYLTKEEIIQKYCRTKT